MTRSGGVQLIGDIARKRGDLEHLIVEAAKTRAAVAVGERSGLFTTPAVLALDSTAGVLDCQRVHGFESLLTLAIRRDGRLADLCGRTGVALAEIHASLRIEGRQQTPLPAPWFGDVTDRCVVHGDLNGSNVGFVPAQDRLVILDWSAAPSLGVPAVVGSRYFDLLWFVLFFFRFRPFPLMTGWHPESWGSAFLVGYASRASSFSMEALRRYHERVTPAIDADLRDERFRRGRGVRRVPFALWQLVNRRRSAKFLSSLAKRAEFRSR